MRLDQVKLVDESEAERKLRSRAPCNSSTSRPNGNCASCKRLPPRCQGESTLRPEANIFRPTVFARALSNATGDLGLSAGERNLLLRIGAKMLAELLRNFYAEICDGLRDQGYTRWPTAP